MEATLRTLREGRPGGPAPLVVLEDAAGAPGGAALLRRLAAEARAAGPTVALVGTRAGRALEADATVDAFSGAASRAADAREPTRVEVRGLALGGDASHAAVLRTLDACARFADELSARGPARPAGAPRGAARTGAAASGASPAEPARLATVVVDDVAWLSTCGVEDDLETDPSAAVVRRAAAVRARLDAIARRPSVRAVVARCSVDALAPRAAALLCGGAAVVAGLELLEPWEEQAARAKAEARREGKQSEARGGRPASPGGGAALGAASEPAVAPSATLAVVAELPRRTGRVRVGRSGVATRASPGGAGRAQGAAWPAEGGASIVAAALPKRAQGKRGEGSEGAGRSGSRTSEASALPGRARAGPGPGGPAEAPPGRAPSSSGASTSGSAASASARVPPGGLPFSSPRPPPSASAAAPAPAAGSVIRAGVSSLAPPLATAGGMTLSLTPEEAAARAELVMAYERGAASTHALTLARGGDDFEAILPLAAGGASKEAGHVLYLRDSDEDSGAESGEDPYDSLDLDGPLTLFVQPGAPSSVVRCSLGESSVFRPSIPSPRSLTPEPRRLSLSLGSPPPLAARVSARVGRGEAARSERRRARSFPARAPAPLPTPARARAAPQQTCPRGERPILVSAPPHAPPLSSSLALLAPRIGEALFPVSSPRAARRPPGPPLSSPPRASPAARPPSPAPARPSGSGAPPPRVRSPCSPARDRGAMFFGTVKIGDLNDFIAPSQACVVALTGELPAGDGTARGEGVSPDADADDRLGGIAARPRRRRAVIPRRRRALGGSTGAENGDEVPGAGDGAGAAGRRDVGEAAGAGLRKVALDVGDDGVLAAKDFSTATVAISAAAAPAPPAETLPESTLFGLDFLLAPQPSSDPSRLGAKRATRPIACPPGHGAASSAADSTTAAPVKLTLRDCLACSGCVTTAESILLESQSADQVDRCLSAVQAWRVGAASAPAGGATVAPGGTEPLEAAAAPAGDPPSLSNAPQPGTPLPPASLPPLHVVFTLSPASVASVAAALGVSRGVAGRALAAALGRLGAHAVLDGAGAREISLAETIEEVIEKASEAAKAARESTGDLGATGPGSPPGAERGTSGGWARLSGPRASAPSSVTLSSSCPGWICYVEKTHPAALPYVSAARSPMAVSGSLVKRVWAPRNAVDPAAVFHCAVMPCFDKKLEAVRDDFVTDTDGVGDGSGNDRVSGTNGNGDDRVANGNGNGNGNESTAADAGEILGRRDAAAQAALEAAGGPFEKETDCVLATTELVALLEKRGVEFTRAGLEAELSRAQAEVSDRADGAASPLLPLLPGPPPGRTSGSPGLPSPPPPFGGPGAASGGYLEAVTRAVAERVFEAPVSATQPLALVSGRNADFREASIVVGGRTVFRSAAAHGFRNIQGIVRRAKTNTCPYSFVEIMACPSGCANGGGQVRGDAFRRGAEAEGEAAAAAGISTGGAAAAASREMWNVAGAVERVEDAYLWGEAGESYDRSAAGEDAAIARARFVRAAYRAVGSSGPGDARAQSLFRTQYHVRSKPKTSAIADW